MRPEINIKEYRYILPEEKIAKYPLLDRDASKILIFKENSITESKFSNLVELLPSETMLIRNNTKVVPARLFFRKSGGAMIEILCLEPHSPSEYISSFESLKECSWLCIVGNRKRWKEGEIYFEGACSDELKKINLKAFLIENIEDKSIVKFEWDSNDSFSKVLELCGKVPIPPYLKRESEESDTTRYQTLYAKYQGSVAAPTAGLHFSEKILNEIANKRKDIDSTEVCLHVGAGTFLPVKSDLISEHTMHSEPFSVTLSFLEKLYELSESKNVLSVGTTVTRTIESLYYIGVRCLEGRNPFEVLQWEPYEREYNYSVKESIDAIIKYMYDNKLDVLKARTSIIIVPSFRFRIVDVLITNFHQPSSTLLLLIAAFVGNYWKSIYRYALDNDFRFLSYGDSSILFRPK